MARIHFKDLIIFEDTDYLIINKPHDISTLEDRTADINILKLAREYQKSLRVCHRLDKETSGVLVLARNNEAYKHLNLQFEKREVNKIYHAVVEGIGKFDYIMFSAPIKVLKKGLAKIDRREGKEAHTIFNTSRLYKNHTLIQCNPVTGRLHQIRVHLSTLGHPIVGDIQYGGALFYLSHYKKKYNVKKTEEEQPVMARVALHAFSIKFVKPNGETVEVQAPYPKDFDIMVKQMEKFSN